MTDDFIALNLDAGEHQTFPSIGRCIYCGASDVKLTDEHIVPLGLTGNAPIFKKAVCGTCRDITHGYEARVLKRMYGNLRIQMGTPTRRPEERPAVLRHTFILLDEAMNPIEERVIERPWERSPVACPSWHGPEPGFLHGHPKATDIPGRQWAYTSPWIESFVDEVRAEIGHAGPLAYRVGDVLARDYLRFIAKVTHAYAIALFGFDAFEHWLVPLILCQDDAVSYLVGCHPDIAPAVPNGSAIKIDFGHPVEDLPVLVAQVRLFEFLGTPEHLVVVGAAPAQKLPRRLPLDAHGRPQ